MRIQKSIPTISYRPIRLASFFFLLVSVPCALFLRENTPASPLLLALSHYCLASCSILLLLATSREDSARFFAFMTILVAMAAVLVLDCIVGQPLRSILRLASALIFTLPHCVLQTRSVYADIHDMMGPSRRASAWDSVNNSIRLTYLCYFLSLVILCSSFGDSASWPLHAFFLLAAFVLFSLLMIRSITADPSLVPTADKEPEMPPASPTAAPEGYTKMYDTLCKYMEEKKPFLKDACRLEDIARLLCTNKSYVSRMISMCAGMSFPQFMNSYRVRYAVSLYKSNMRLKVSELAVRSGFHSTVSFCMSFKMFMHTTPSEWCMEYTDKVMAERRSRSHRSTDKPRDRQFLHFRPSRRH